MVGQGTFAHCAKAHQMNNLLKKDNNARSEILGSSAGPCLPHKWIHGPSLEITDAYSSSSVDAVIIFSPKEVTSHYYLLEICLDEISAIRMIK